MQRGPVCSRGALRLRGACRCNKARVYGWGEGRAMRGRACALGECNGGGHMHAGKAVRGGGSMHVLWGSTMMGGTHILGGRPHACRGSCRWAVPWATLCPISKPPTHLRLFGALQPPPGAPGRTQPGAAAAGAAQPFLQGQECKSCPTPPLPWLSPTGPPREEKG